MPILENCFYERREQAATGEKALTPPKRNETIPVHYKEENLELWFASVSACLYTCLKRKDHCTGASFYAAAIMFLSSVVRAVVTLFETHLLLPKVRIMYSTLLAC